MPVVSLKQRGYYFETDFSEGADPLTWEVTPSNSDVTTGTGGLLLQQGAAPVHLFLSELTNMKQFRLDLKNEYTPQTEQDMGGLIVYADDNDFIAVEEYYQNGEAHTFPWLRIVRDYNTYYAYWSEDGSVWNLIGSETFDRLAPKIGIFVQGDSPISMKAQHVRVVESTKVTVENVQAGMLVQLVDEQGAVLTQKRCRTNENKVELSIGHLTLPVYGKFVIQTDIGTLQGSRYQEVYGGDVYEYEIQPELLYSNQETGVMEYLDSGVDEFLGYLNAPSGQMYRDTLIYVRNPLPGTFNDITLTLASYGDYDHYLHFVEVAPDVDGVPGTFSSSVTIPTLATGEEKVFWLRMKRDETKPISEVYFAIKLDTSYFFG